MSDNPPEQSWIKESQLGDLFGMLLNPPTPPDIESEETQDEIVPPKIQGLTFIKVIGVGGFARVWLAEDRALNNRKIAVKILHTNLISKEATHRFRNEISSLARLNHPSIASIYSSGITKENQPFLIMEYVPGEAIDTFCSKNQLSILEIVSLIIEACSALEYAHSLGVIHRDIKSSNILVFKDAQGVFRLRIIDFGIAKDFNNIALTQFFYTDCNSVLGTPAFMPPEQTQPDAVPDPRNDIFSLGAVFYCLLCGLSPYQSKPGDSITINTILQQKKINQFCNVSRKLKINSSHSSQFHKIPQTIDKICSAAIHPDPQLRYPSMRAFRDDLEAVLHNKPPQNLPKIPLWLHVKLFCLRSPIITICLILAIIQIGILVYFSNNQTDKNQLNQNTSTQADSLASNSEAASLFFSSQIQHSKKNFIASDNLLRTAISIYPYSPCCNFSFALTQSHYLFPTIYESTIPLPQKQFPQPPEKLAISNDGKSIWATFPSHPQKIFLWSYTNSKTNFPQLKEITLKQLANVKYIFPLNQENSALAVSSTGQFAIFSPTSNYLLSTKLPSPPLSALKASTSNTILLTTAISAHLLYPISEKLFSWNCPSPPTPYNINPNGNSAHIQTDNETLYHISPSYPQFLQLIQPAIKFNAPNKIAISNDSGKLAILSHSTLSRYELPLSKSTPNAFSFLEKIPEKISFLPDNETLILSSTSPTQLTFINSSPGSEPAKVLDFPSPPDKLFVNPFGTLLAQLKSNEFYWINPSIPVKLNLPQHLFSPYLVSSSSGKFFISYSKQNSLFIRTEIQSPRANKNKTIAINPDLSENTQFYFSNGVLHLLAPNMSLQRWNSDLSPIYDFSIPPILPEQIPNFGRCSIQVNQEFAAKPYCLGSKQTTLHYSPISNSLTFENTQDKTIKEITLPERISAVYLISPTSAICVTRERRFIICSVKDNEQSQIFLPFSTPPISFCGNESGLFAFFFEDGSVRFWHPEFQHVASLSILTPTGTFAIALSEEFLFCLTTDGRIVRLNIPPVPSKSENCSWLIKHPRKLNLSSEGLSPFAKWCQEYIKH